jgi:hypothetical protein
MNKILLKQIARAVVVIAAMFATSAGIGLGTGLVAGFHQAHAGR